tara:strand:+ start:57174 stop:58034 length:861 start_codon:yes stop_codon:yes gene_type:complete
MDNISAIILAIALFVIMLGMGLSLVTNDFKNILLNPKAIFVGLMNQLILLPLLSLALVLIFPLQPEIAIGIILIAACPGGPTSNLISFMAKADLALSVSLTAFSSLITVLTIPFFVNFALSYFLEENAEIELNILQTIGQMLVIVILPIVVGMFIRGRAPEFALRMGKPVRIASGVILVLIIIGLIIKERANFTSYFQQAGLATLLLNIATMLVGFGTAKLFKLERRQAFSIAIESGIQNGTLAITIAVVLLGNTAFAIAPSVYSVLMFLTGGFVIFLSLRKQPKS